MGEKDLKAKKYIKDNRVFADVVNYCIFAGNEVVLPENLHEKDPTEITTLYGVSKKIRAIQRNRDILKGAVYKESDSAKYLIFGIENQTELHYAMSVKNALYDSINYAAQVDAVSNKHRQNLDYGQKAEFLSGFQKGDLLVPVITITLYLGTDDWDAPRSLHEMMDLDNSIKPYVQDYRLNLLIPSEIEDFSLFRSEIGLVLNALAVGEDPDAFGILLKSHKEFRSMDYRTADMIKTFAGLKGMVLRKNKEEKVDMCKAMEKLMEQAERDGERRGEKRGKISGYNEGKKDTIITLVRKELLTTEQGAVELGIPVAKLDALLRT